MTEVQHSPAFLAHGSADGLTAQRRTHRKAQALTFGWREAGASPGVRLLNTFQQGAASSNAWHPAASVPAQQPQAHTDASSGGQPRRRRVLRHLAAPFAWIDIFGHRSEGLRTAISQSWAQIDVDQSGSLSLADLEGYAKQHGLPREYVQNFVDAVLRASPSAPNAPTTAQPAAQALHADSQQHSDTLTETAAPAPSDGTAAGLSQPHQLQPLVQIQPQPELPLLPPLAALTRWLSPAAGQLQGAAEAAPLELTFSQFETFVKSRETALRKAFDMFDRDKDGVISADDLEASLTHIAICCPRSRCVYRCPRAMAHAMLERTQAVSRPSASNSGSIDFASFRRFFMLLPETDLAVEYWLRAGTLPLLTEKLAAVHEEQEPGPVKAAAWGHLFAGAVAGAASRTATAPLETLRLAVMTGAIPNTNLVQAASSIVAEQGWRGLYRGNALNVLRSAPQKALDFFAFDLFKRMMAGQSQQQGTGVETQGGPGAAFRTFMAAGLAGATSWALLYPLETVRSRVTAGLVPAGQGLMQVAGGIVRSEGAGALYRGLGWSLAGMFPEAALCYGLHDLLKQLYRRTNQGQEPGVVTSLGFGVLSAFTGQLVAFPLETVARRLQVYQGPGGLPTMLRTMVQNGGPAVFYRGVGAATLRLVPMAIVSFGTYEVVRAALLALEDSAGAVVAENEYAQIHSYCKPLNTTLSQGVSKEPHAGQGVMCAGTGTSTGVGVSDKAGAVTACSPAATTVCLSAGSPGAVLTCGTSVSSSVATTTQPPSPSFAATSVPPSTPCTASKGMSTQDNAEQGAGPGAPADTTICCVPPGTNAAKIKCVVVDAPAGPDGAVATGMPVVRCEVPRVCEPVPAKADACKAGDACFASTGQRFRT